MFPTRVSSLVGPSLSIMTLIWLAAACSGAPESGDPSGSGAGSPSGSGSGSGTGGSTQTASCPQADSMLDVTKGPGAGSSYPKPKVTASCSDTSFIVESNAIPPYKFVPITPTPLAAQALTWQIAREPKEAAATTEVPRGGYAGFAVNGLPFFGPNEGATPVESAYGDPVYNKLMDACEGHTSDMYHYHSLVEKCLNESSLVEEPWMNADPPKGEPSPILAWALDGFPVYGSRECADKECSKVVVLESGYEMTGDPKTNAWDAYTWKEHAGDATFLDKCNGHHGPSGDYHYHLTSGFPYIIGCYRGTPNGILEGGDMGGPKACTMEADCQTANACPQGSKGCTCHDTPNGKGCVPTCSTAADCPKPPMGQIKCNQGICTP